MGVHVHILRSENVFYYYYCDSFSYFFPPSQNGITFAMETIFNTIIKDIFLIIFDPVYIIVKRPTKVQKCNILEAQNLSQCNLLRLTCIMQVTYTGSAHVFPNTDHYGRVIYDDTIVFSHSTSSTIIDFIQILLYFNSRLIKTIDFVYLKTVRPNVYLVDSFCSNSSQFTSRSVSYRI